MTGPMSPKEIVKFKAEITPEFVYQAINELLAETINPQGTASFFFRAAVTQISEAMDSVDEFKGLDFGERKRIIEERGWLNIENAYRAKGWEVKTDRTDDTGAGFFVFTPR